MIFSARQSYGNPGAYATFFSKGCWADLAEGRMTAPAVVETLNGVHDFATGLVAAVEHLSSNQFLLQGRKKAFDRSIVVAIVVLPT